MRKKIILVLMLVFSAPNLGFAWDSKDPDVVKSFDVTAYMGLWYEIAHKPNFFQRNCDRSTAEYSLNSDGSIKVYNVCYQNEKVYSTISGVAKAKRSDEPTKLVVDFGFFRKGDYWIIDLDENYQWAVVSGPSLKSLFILSRTRKMDSAVLENILAELKKKGFETDRFVFDK